MSEESKVKERRKGWAEVIRIRRAKMEEAVGEVQRKRRKSHRS